MQYGLLIYETAELFALRDVQEDGEYVAAWRAYYRAMQDAGIYKGGAPLLPPEIATTVRQRDNRRSIQDGPYANTKEQLAGIIMVELPTLDAALDWAARCPAAAYGCVEVRPLAPAAHERITGERL